MNVQTAVIRPKISSTDEDPVGKALGKHGMSKFAGCPDVFMGAVYDRTLGRYLTGLDENHPDVLNLPQEERLAKQKEILDERAHLEKELGINLHHTNEEFWSTVPIVLDRGKMYNPLVPKDRIVILAIQAGKMVPTSKDDIGNPNYLGVSFYMGGEFEDVKEKSISRAKEREIVIKLASLLDKLDYAVEICNYLGILGVTHRTPKDNVDDLLSLFIEKKASNGDLFLEAVKEKEEFIRLSNKFREFRTLGLVKYDDGRWMSGKVKLGKTEKESVKKLLSSNPDMQAELSNLLENYNEVTGKNND